MNDRYHYETRLTVRRTAADDVPLGEARGFTIYQIERTRIDGPRGDIIERGQTPYSGQYPTRAAAAAIMADLTP